jgi:hypothetical protein
MRLRRARRVVSRQRSTVAGALPLVLFGACDRHNLGDLLFPHLVAAAHPGREIHYCGLATRDLRPFGGHAVQALPEALAALAGRPFELIHVGGELLDCDAYTAAVMLEAPDAARTAIAHYDADQAAAARWAATRLGTDRPAPYVLDKAALPGCARLAFNAVGGVDLDARPEALRRQVCAALAHADALTVRDATTQATLAAAGIAADLAPDPVAALPAHPMSAALRERGAGLRAGYGDYLAVQFSADCGDDASLAALATALEQRADGKAIVLFRAGAAPWHDALEPYGRLAARLGARCHIFTELDIHAIGALLAGASGYVGTSLHGCIVARACGVPAVGLERTAGAGRKLRAWRAAWAPDMPVIALAAQAKGEDS